MREEREREIGREREGGEREREKEAGRWAMSKKCK